MCPPQAQILYHTPGSLRVRHSVLAVLRTVLFWTEASDVAPGISSSLEVTTRHIPVTRATFAFAFHIFFCSFLLMLLSAGIETSVTTVLFFSLLTTTIWSAFSGASHQDLGASNPHFSGVCCPSYHLHPSDCLRGLFAPSLYESCAQGLLLHCHDQSLYAVLKASLF